MTILISSHMLEELFKIATDFIFVSRGKIICETSSLALNDRYSGISPENIYIKILEDSWRENDKRD